MITAPLDDIKERRLFVLKNLSISPTKSWIGYLSAQVLGFHVDALGLSITAERVAAFAKLKFPRQLAALEQYIGATGYIQHLIPYYAKIMEPLQKRKVALLAEGRRTDKIVDGNRGKRKSYTKNIYYNPTLVEKIAF
ncbi:uncharacterized protein FFFS_04311 [Fusarium fujikuroi]|nr:uncharacterized protein FFFS_04311 [Fusarium fujikuroi]